MTGSSVITATEQDSVYALDADTGASRWRTTLGQPVPLSQLECGDITSNGITSTPVIDEASGVVYAVAMLMSPIRHEIFALRIADGGILWHRPVDPPGADPKYHQQRGSLNLANGYVYMGFGGFSGDCGTYHGWVVGAPASGAGALHQWQVPSSNEGAIWAPPGPIVSASGDVWVTTGNTAAGPLDSNDGSNSVFRLDSHLRSATDSWSPKNWALLNAGDADLGSASPALLSSGLVFVAAKEGVGYLLRADHLGGVGGEAFKSVVCVNARTFFGAYGGAAVSGRDVFVPCSNALVAVRVDAAKPSFTIAWRSPGRANSPILAYGLLWTVVSTISAERVWSGTLEGLDAATGKIVARAPLGPTPHFPSPTAANGKLYVAGLGMVYAVATT